MAKPRRGISFGRMRSRLWRLLVLMVGIVFTAMLAFLLDNRFGNLGSFVGYFVGLTALALALHGVPSGGRRKLGPDRNGSTLGERHAQPGRGPRDDGA